MDGEERWLFIKHSIITYCRAQVIQKNKKLILGKQIETKVKFSSKEFRNSDQPLDRRTVI